VRIFILRRFITPSLTPILQEGRDVIPASTKSFAEDLFNETLIYRFYQMLLGNSGRVEACQPYDYPAGAVWISKEALEVIRESAEVWDQSYSYGDCCDDSAPLAKCSLMASIEYCMMPSTRV
jgi:hypothetical protein